jgi:predicted heme/steroid binding protein/uncharacterized membrane protein
MREFTSEELLSCNGKEGKPVYIAFEGKVYEVSKSSLWSKGTHMNRHPSGKDLSGEISAAPHGPEVLERYPQIGILKKGPSEELKHLPKFLQGLLQTFPMAKRHPHPMIVHFPIAFLMASSFLYLLYFILLYPPLSTTSTHLLILGAISTPFAIATGLLTWWVNYKLKLTPFIKRKIQLSIFLLVIEAIFFLFLIGEIEISYYLYLILMLLFAPVVILLGYYGGQMTFPAEKV